MGICRGLGVCLGRPMIVSMMSISVLFGDGGRIDSVLVELGRDRLR